MLWQILSKLINIPLLCLFYCGLAFIISPAQYGNSVLLGLPWDFTDGGLDPFVYGKWLMITIIPVLVNGIILERGKQIEIFFTLRMRKRGSFQLWMLSACSCTAILWGVVLTLGVLFIYEADTAVMTCPLLISNLLLWSVIQITLYFMFHHAVWSGWVTFLLNAGGGFLGLYIRPLSRFIPSFWGMFIRSSFMPEQVYGIHNLNYFLMIFANIFFCLSGILILLKGRRDI